MIPSVTKAKFKSQLNKWFHKSATGKAKVRGATVVFLASIIMIFAYIAASQGIEEHLKNETINLTIKDIINIYMAMIFFMLFFSNIIVSLTTLFMSQSLVQLVSSPISYLSFFNAKLIQTLFSSSWIVIVFSFPLLLALGVKYDANFYYYLNIFLILIPFLLIPASLSMIVSVVSARLFSVSKLRFIFLILSLGFIILLLAISQKNDPDVLAKNNLELLSQFKLKTSSFMLADWVSSTIVAFLENKKINSFNYLCLYAVSILSYLIAYFSFRVLFLKGYDKAISSKSSSNIKSRESQRLLTLLTPFLSSQRRAFYIKEFKTFCRDVAQSIQFLVLLVLCLIYLINLSRIDISTLEGNDFIATQALLNIIHMAMSGFIMCALCTRFVYTSISLEGKSYWMILKAPLSSKEFIKTKFRFWFFAISIISTVVFVSGSMALFVDPIVLFFQFIFAISISFGLVGLAITFGIFFVYFDWEHVSQLATNFGSILYMFGSAILIIVSMIPHIVLLGAYILKENYTFEFSDTSWYLFVSLSLFLSFFINYCVASFGIRRGGKILEEVFS